MAIFRLGGPIQKGGGGGLKNAPKKIRQHKWMPPYGINVLNAVVVETIN